MTGARAAVVLWSLGGVMSLAATVAAIVADECPLAVLGWLMAAVASAGAAISAHTLVLYQQVRDVTNDQHAEANRAEFCIIWDSAIAWLAVHGSDHVDGHLLEQADHANPWRTYREDWKEQAP